MTKKQRKLQEAIELRRVLYLREYDVDEMCDWPLSRIMDFIMKYRR